MWAIIDVSADTVAKRIDYDAWGNITTDTAPAFQSLGYAGGLTDRATGLVRFGARDYDPSVGRWTAKDPIGIDSREANLFQYGSAAPIGNIDDSGLRDASGGGGRTGVSGLLHSAACTGRLVGKSSGGYWDQSLAEKYRYYFDMVHTGATFDVLHNEYADDLSPDQQKALGNALAGELAAALDIPWWVAVVGARIAHANQSVNANQKWQWFLGAVHGQWDTPGDEIEELRGYLDFKSRLRGECPCTGN